MCEFVLYFPKRDMYVLDAFSLSGLTLRPVQDTSCFLHLWETQRRLCFLEEGFFYLCFFLGHRAYFVLLIFLFNKKVS